MRGADAIELPQILIEHLCVGRVHNGFGFGLWQARQRAHAALRKEHVAMSLRIADTAFVSEWRIEPAGQTESIGRLLCEPPSVFASRAIVMVRAAQPVHVSDINSVPPHIFERAIIAPISADFGVPMKFA